MRLPAWFGCPCDLRTAEEKAEDERRERADADADACPNCGSTEIERDGDIDRCAICGK